MAILTRIIEQFAALMVKMGIPAEQSTLAALILIYLLVTGVLTVFLVFIFRRRQRQQKKKFSSSDLES
jgi:heme/copper-type cytochrome/quinol oxidase subunit 2